MQNDPTTLVKNATSHSKTNEASRPTTKTFTVNPFKKYRLDPLTVAIILTLVGGAVLFLMAMRMIANAT